MTEEKIVWIPLRDWADEGRRRQVESLWSDPILSRVVTALYGAGANCVLVGGSVRDLLSGRESKDLDLVVECSRDKLLGQKSELASLVEASPVVLDAGRGILRLCFAEHQELDLVALQGDTLWEDLARRDLSVNAMALNPQGELADPFSGLVHLRQGVLSRVREGNFRDDPLRVLRLLRFAAQLDFEIDSETFEEAVDALEGLGRVAGERVLVELQKFFSSAKPASLENLKSSCLEAFLNVEVGQPQWNLMFEISRVRPLGWPLGLALWLGVEAGSVPVADRLKLSRQDVRWLSSWEAACRFAKVERGWESADIFELSIHADSTFAVWAEALVFESFPVSMSRQDRVRVLKEAQGVGSIDWSAPPWNGEAVSRKLEREPGPWLKETMAGLAKAWATGKARNLEEGLRLLGGC